MVQHRPTSDPHAALDDVSFPPPEGKNAVEDVTNAAGVLVVEDDFLIGMQTASALSDAGFHVVGIAATAEEAIFLARQCNPSIAVMDVHLDGPRDGIDSAGDLFHELGIRCIFASAHVDERTRARAEPFAPLGWLAKPYTMASLIALVRRAVAAST